MDLPALLDSIFPDPETCRRSAEELRLADSGATPEQVATRAITQSRTWAASIGATTGLFASPFTMLPAALADAAAMLKLEAQLAGTIAALVDPGSLDDPATFRNDILRAIFPGAVSQALRRLGIRAAENTAKSTLRALTTRAATKELTERATRALGVRLAEKAVASKLVPVVGAAIGAAWNYAELQAVGRRSLDYHLGREPVERRAIRKVRDAAGALSDRLLRKEAHPDCPAEGTRDCTA